MTADTGFSAAFAIGDGAATEVFTAVAEVMSITPPGQTREAIDATHLTSANGYREFIAGMADGGEASIELNYTPSESDVLIAALVAGVGNFRITAPSGKTLTFAGVCTAHSPGPMVVDDKMTLSATFKVSGRPTWAAA